MIWNDLKLADEGGNFFASLLEACNLTAKQNSKASTLSGGQKRQLQLACMLAGSTVCLLDEASSGLVSKYKFLSSGWISLADSL